MVKRLPTHTSDKIFGNFHKTWNFLFCEPMYFPTFTYLACTKATHQEKQLWLSPGVAQAHIDAFPSNNAPMEPMAPSLPAPREAAMTMGDESAASALTSQHLGFQTAGHVKV